MISVCLQTVTLAPGAFPHLQNGDDIHMISPFVCIVTVGFFEPRLFLIEVPFSLCYSCIAVDLPACTDLSLVLNCPSLPALLTQSEL